MSSLKKYEMAETAVLHLRDAADELMYADGADGKPESLLSVSRDITELKRAEEQQRLLALEMNHRIKNVLAMVQAIASQCRRPEDGGAAGSRPSRAATGAASGGEAAADAACRLCGADRRHDRPRARPLCVACAGRGRASRCGSGGAT